MDYLKFRKAIWPLASLLFLSIAIIGTDFGVLAKSVSSANIILVLSSVFAGLGSYLVWSWNWKIFGKSVGLNIGFLRAFQLFTSNNLVNLVNPVGNFGGQFIASYNVHKESERSFSSALAAFTSADLISLIAAPFSMLAVYLVLILTGSVPQIVKNGLPFATASILVVGLLGYLLWSRSSALSNIVDSSFIEGLADSYVSIGKKPKDIAKVAVLANIAYILRASTLILSAYSIGIELGIVNAFLVLSLTSITRYIPINSSGARVASISATLSLLGPASYATALSIGLVYEISTYWLGTSLGFITMNSMAIGKIRK